MDLSDLNSARKQKPGNPGELKKPGDFPLVPNLPAPIPENHEFSRSDDSAGRQS
jgi:hypothetical protein